MHRELLKIVSVFLSTWIVLTIYSFSYKKNKSVSLKPDEIELKKAPIETIFQKDIRKIYYGQAVKNLDSKYFSLFEKKNEPDTTKQRFLYFGDSMQEGLIKRWNDYCKKNNHEINSVIWYSSSTKNWGSCDTLTYFIKKYKPTYIICVLGSNELFIRDIKENRTGYIKHILKQVGKTKFIWIGPPNWKEDTGINDLISENIGEERFFLTKGMKFDRKKDGAHPTYESAYKWADSIARWIVKKSFYPIKLIKPDTLSCRAPATTILKPVQ